MIEMPGPSDILVNIEVGRLLDENEISRDERKFLDEALSAFFSKGPAVLNVWLVVSFFFKIYHNPSIAAAVCSIAYAVCLILAFCLHCLEGIGFGCRLMQQQVNWWRCQAAYLSIVLRMVAAAALLLFLDGAHAIVVVPLLFLAFALVAYLFLQTFYLHPEYEYPGMNWGDHKEELEVRSNLSAQVVSLAFGGLSGTVLGYVNAASPESSNLTTGRAAVGPEGFLFYGVVLGLLVLLLTTVPTRIKIRSTRILVAKTCIPCLAYSALLSLVVAAALAAAVILRAYVFFVCYPIVVPGAIFVWRRQPSTERDLGERVKQLAELSNYWFPFLTTLFTVLMTAYSKYSTASGSTLSLSWWFKGFVFSALSSILFYAILVVVLADRPDMRSRPWHYATIGAMAIAAICAVAAVSQNPAELKNIL